MTIRTATSRGLAALLGLILASQLMPAARADDYPSRSITFIAPYAPGGIVDTTMRLLGARLAERLGKSVIIENRPGAGTVLAATAVARAAPDGYTMMWGGSTTLAVVPAIYRKLTFDPIKDFIPVVRLPDVPFVLVVNPSMPVHSLADLIAYARQRPGELSYGTPGPGTPQHLGMELLKTMTGIEMTHVPYKGNTPAMTDLLSGHIPLMFSDPTGLPIIADGKVRPIAVSSANRMAELPDVPTIAEAGLPGFEVVAWVMMVVPANTPPDIVGRLHTEFKAVLAAPEFKARISKLGSIPLESPPVAELPGFVRSEIVRWSKMVEQAGLAGSQ